jgi:hypothetical protein
MSHLSVGERVELKSCTGISGTITGFARSRVEVLFDDCRNEPAKLFRPESLQRMSVPKTVASGTGIRTISPLQNQVFSEEQTSSLLEQPRANPL